MWWLVIGVGGFFAWLFSGGSSGGDPCVYDPSQCGGGSGVITPGGDFPSGDYGD